MAEGGRLGRRPSPAAGAACSERRAERAGAGPTHRGHTPQHLLKNPLTFHLVEALE